MAAAYRSANGSFGLHITRPMSRKFSRSISLPGWCICNVLEIAPCVVPGDTSSVTIGRAIRTHIAIFFYSRCIASGHQERRSKYGCCPARESTVIFRLYVGYVDTFDDTKDSSGAAAPFPTDTLPSDNEDEIRQVQRLVFRCALFVIVAYAVDICVKPEARMVLHRNVHNCDDFHRISLIAPTCRDCSSTR